LDRSQTSNRKRRNLVLRVNLRGRRKPESIVLTEASIVIDLGDTRVEAIRTVRIQRIEERKKNIGTKRRDVMMTMKMMNAPSVKRIEKPNLARCTSLVYLAYLS